MADLYRNAVTGAQEYDLISGDVVSFNMDGNQITVGRVRDLARPTSSPSWTEGSGTSVSGASGAIPPAGHAIFFLGLCRDAHRGSGYGTESVPLPREPLSCNGGCPGD